MKAPAASPGRVFISYSSSDSETADTLCRLLEERGVACWMAPRDVSPGAKYGEAILQAIEDASALVLIFSEHANNSEQVMNEVERAVSKKKRGWTRVRGRFLPSATSAGRTMAHT